MSQATAARYPKRFPQRFPERFPERYPERSHAALARLAAAHSQRFPSQG